MQHLSSKFLLLHCSQLLRFQFKINFRGAMFFCCRSLQRFETVKSVGEECTQEDELLNILANKPEPVCYDGFEPSGRMDIAQVIILNIRYINMYNGPSFSFVNC